LFPIALDRPFDADQRDPKGAGNVRLLGRAIDAKLRRDHAKSRNIPFGVAKDRQPPVEIGHLAIPFFNGHVRADGLHSLRKQG
jgi:hypothetical protein